MNLTQKVQKRTTVLQQYISYKNMLHHLYLEGEVGSKMSFNKEECIVWCLNDYLGLMNEAKAKHAATVVTEKFGPSYPHSVRLTIGHTPYHDDLETDLSKLLGLEDAMLVNLGYQGFFSIIDALTDRHDTIIYDQKCHACLIDGIRLHQGDKFSFRHNNVEHLEKILVKKEKNKKQGSGMTILIVDGLYSMTGRLAPLDEIVALKEKYNFSLLVDDSHAFGVFGPNGLGSPEHFGVMDEVDVYLSTFTKSFGNLGGFVAASKSIIDYLRFSVRSQIFSRSMPLPMVASVSENLKTFIAEPQRREKLFRNINRFKIGLDKIGINYGNSDGPIVPLFINGSNEDGLKVYFDLRKENIFSYIVAYPVVEKDKCMIRMVCTYNHTEEEIDRTLFVLGVLAKKYPVQLLTAKLLPT